MAITQIGAHTTDSVASGTSVSPAKPTGVAQGDVLVASVTQNNQTVTAPSGWVKFEDRNATGTTGDVWRRVPDTTSAESGRWLLRRRNSHRR